MNPKADVVFSNLTLNLNKKLTEKQKRVIRKNPYGDYDRDSIINIVDSNPTNPYKHGIISTLKSFGQRVGTTLGLGKKKTPPKATLRILPETTYTTPTTIVKAEATPSGIVVTTTSKTTGASITRVVKTEAEASKILQAQVEAEKVAPLVTEVIPPTPTPPPTKEQVEKEKLGLGKIAGKIFAPSIWVGEKVVSKAKEVLAPSIVPKIIKGFEEVISYPAKVVTGKEEEYWKEKVTFGKREFAPTQIGMEKGTAIVTKITPYTKEEIIALPFAGTEEIERRELSTAQFNASQVVKSKAGELLPSYQTKVSASFDKWQGRINAGGVSLEEANKFYQQDIDKIQKEFELDVARKSEPEIKIIEKKYETKISDVAKKQNLNKAIALAPIYVGTGFALGFIGGAIPVAGKVLTGAGIALAVTKAPEITEVIKRGDIYELGAMGITVGAFGVGALAGGYAGGKLYTETKITQAINRAKTTSHSIELTRIAQIKGLKISPEGQKYVQDMLDKGYTISRIQTKLKPSSSADAKYLPDVRGNYLEILSRDGKLVDSVSLGNVVGKYKGVSFTRGVISKATGKVNEGQATYFTRTFLSKGKGNFKPVEYYEFLEVGKITAFKQAKAVKVIKQTGEIELLKQVVKPKPSDITKIVKLGKPSPETMEQFFKALPKGKPYGKFEVGYIGKEIVEIGIKTKGVKGWKLAVVGKVTKEIGVSKGEFFKYVPPIKPIKVTPFFKTIKKFEAPKIAPPTKVTPTGLISVREFPDLTYILGAPKYYPLQTYGAITEVTAIGLVPSLARAEAISSAFQSSLITGAVLSPKELEVTKIKLAVLTKERLKGKELQRAIQKTIIATKLATKLRQPLIPTQIQPQVQIPEQIILPRIFRPPRVTLPKFKPPKIILPFIPLTRKEKPAKVRVTSYEKRLREQLRAYQVSVGAVQLGIEVPKKKKKYKLPEIFTGAELRPVANKNYAKQLNKILTI